MRIIKQILASVEMEPTEGKIWINNLLGGCFLRIQGLNFKNILQKFNFIDINKTNATLVCGSEEELAGSNELLQFIISISMLLYEKVLIGEFFMMRQDLEGLYKHIEQFFDKKGEKNESTRK